MQRRGQIAFGGFLIVVWAGLSWVLLAKGGLYIAKHEGDTMHLIDMVLRQADGEWAHLDYMSPIGFLATAPIALFVELGFGVGMAILAAQALVGGLLLLPIFWVGISRLKTAWAMVFGALCLVLCMALVHGEAQPSISVSMHYNRWAWALAFLAISIAILPPVQRENRTLDGLILGLAVAGMALIKVTYVAAFLPGVLLALVLRRQFRAMRVAVLAGLAVAVLVTLFAGPAFWFAYLGDVLTVTGSETRPQPGLSLNGVIAAPAYLGGSIAALVAVVLLRQAGRATEGLILLVLVPGFFFVTYQNFGNDPQWLYLLGVLLFALRPAPGTTNAHGWDMRQALALAGCAIFMLGLPSAINLAFSPFRHLASSEDEFVPMFARSEQHGDIFAMPARNATPTGTIKLPVLVEAARAGESEEDDGPTLLLGEELPECGLAGGTVTVYDGIVRDLETSGFAGITPLGADLLASYWLFGDLGRLEGGAPWRYAGLPGVESASHLLVPLCPLDRKARKSMIEAMAAGGYGLKEVHRNEVYVLLEIEAP
ncbi:glycosyltransferase family 87 protein [Tropicimonas sp. IMCC6043]|uniref:glycosyltransferase family 87 protein n=1 Tax=Tropicimonas sp. IMCC6043 TaxID=2510645 RepID=UPI00101BAF49|nr:glycosyltransferase family 87 protein [Tropicimonas sp. IMCC6043]RYH09452.1 hypothetical protein EU800_12315 [Tropicimonas sp. IMCC6043]